MLIFIGFNKYSQNLQAVTLQRTQLGLKKLFYFFQSSFIICFGFDGAYFLNETLLSNNGCVNLVIFPMSTDKANGNIIKP
jgi:hypothetical protein